MPNLGQKEINLKNRIICNNQSLLKVPKIHTVALKYALVNANYYQ